MPATPYPMGKTKSTDTKNRREDLAQTNRNKRSDQPKSKLPAKTTTKNTKK